MIGLIPALVFPGLNAGHPENNHPAGREGQGERSAVYVDKLVYTQPALYFLDIALRVNNKKFFYKHILSIS
jgi:hypothetical protein